MIKDVVTKELLKLLGVRILTLLTPKNTEFGDFAVHLRQLQSQDPALTSEIVLKRLTGSKMMENILEKDGFINIRIKNTIYLHEFEAILKNKSPQVSTIGSGKRVIVEYSSINIAKPFTIGHLRSTIIGDAIANLLESTGHIVYRDNHVGDWGTQFGKQILAVKKWGDENEIESSPTPLKLLVGLYIRFHDEAEKDPTLIQEARDWFKKLEEGDAEARRIWRMCINWSWVEFDKMYKILGVEFTENEGRGYGESYFEDKMPEIIALLEKQNLLKESEEAKLVFFPKDKYPPLMIIKKDGTTLYATRDLATDYFRKNKYGDDIVVINAVGVEQSLYFQQLFEIEEMLGWFRKEQRVHIKHGMYRFKEGKMSTRKGNGIWLEEVLNQAIDKASKLTADKSIVDKVSKAIGIGALKWNDLKRNSQQDVVFDWDDILNMQGNSGPYMQYTYARITSILNKSDDNNLLIPEQHDINKEERSLLVTLSLFEESIESATINYSPHLVCNYLYDLAQKFNFFYEKCPILSAEPKDRDFRLSLCDVTARTIKRGLELLGIDVVDKI